MLAARAQENLVYAHQTNAASKPLNQSTRGLQSKTPGQRALKTPFKSSLNDENRPTLIGAPKTDLRAFAKGDENRLQTKQKDGVLASNAFVTPMGMGKPPSYDLKLIKSQQAGPRTRAPLGIKTTNAKARAFQTPTPLQQMVKPAKTQGKASTARKSIKSKIRIATSEPVETDVLSKEDDMEVPEVEYHPPPPVELLDPPEDITYDDNYPYLRGNNLCAGYSEVYDIPRDEHGVDLRERKAEEVHAQMLQEWEDRFREEMAKPLVLDDEDDMVDAMIAAGPKRVRNQSNNNTLKAKGAVAALSSRPPTRLPSVATRDTASSKQKQKLALPVLSSKSKAPMPTNPSSMRHTAAVAASKSTIGYTKGRSVSSALPENSGRPARAIKKVDQSAIHPLEFRKLYGEPPLGSTMWERFMQHGLFDDNLEQGDDPLAAIWGGGPPVEEAEEEIFQLRMPEGI